METDADLRRLLAACLARHGDPVATREWSWNINPPVPDRDWLETVADLRFLGALGEGQLERVVQVAGDLATDRDSLTLTWLLARGGYDGADKRLISLCADEIADGASDLVDVRRIRNFHRTPLSALVAAGNLHGLRNRRQTPTSPEPTGSSNRRRRNRNHRRGTDLLRRADAFAARLQATGQNWGDAAAWTQLVKDSLELWGTAG